ncbi:aminodeoxychorismate synthase component I [Catenovulum sp. 2E275]|uniref:aminodeoxychorismate synthase component I n=1 Tax=Catenovulum sp. 2E275 TaxID=2980497 RepID=UPI0021D2B080|nr:aminodeoxychorismate synthase component I [Catenovulum sp. 2E275]MCU4674446.1 aminodeoxychorismate synthase component I [Catenovulum sp. 2E275]
MNNQSIYQIDLAASVSATSLFSYLANQQGSILLDSANANHENSRYDIILSAPIATVTHSFGKTSVKLLNGQSQNQNEANPFTVAKQLQQELMPAQLPETDLPFVGGCAGWFSYDLARSIETLPELAQNDIDLPQMHLGVYDWAIIKDNQTGKWFAVDYQPDLFRVEHLLNQYHKQNKQPTEAFKLLSDWQANMSEQSYTAKFDKVKQYLVDGDCYQINLAQRFSADYTGDCWQAYLALRDSNQAPFSAYIKYQDHSIISISPERFLQLNEHQVQTKPIKGTISRGQSLKQDNAFKASLKSSEKDRAENLMIVDLLRNDISRVCQPGSVRVPRLFEIESFPAVHHLVSTVTGQLQADKSPFDLLEACFPGGSITGAPKVRAMEIIEELEPHRRSIYCGSIGYIDWRGNMDTNIAIRTLVADNESIHCWAGGGLVYDSKMKSEYKETFDKVNKILPVLSSL